jgi:hypothetical protein
VSEPRLSVSESASLERGYRRLLAWYPKWFRLQNTEEVLAVLMACVQDGQTRPSLEAAVDLLKGAARMRLRPMPGQPRTVFAAVWLMIAGAAAELGVVVTLLATQSGIKADLIARYPAYAHAIGHAVNLQFILDVVVGPIVIAVWLWLAWMSSRGKQRGRVAFAVFFGVTTLSVLYSLSQGSLVYAPAAMSVGLGIWAIAAAAIMLIFNKASSPYFQRRGPALASRG